MCGQRFTFLLPLAEPVANLWSGGLALYISQESFQPADLSLVRPNLTAPSAPRGLNGAKSYPICAPNLLPDPGMQATPQELNLPPSTQRIEVIMLMKSSHHSHYQTCPHFSQSRVRLRSSSDDYSITSCLCIYTDDKLCISQKSHHENHLWFGEVTLSYFVP